MALVPAVFASATPAMTAPTDLTGATANWVVAGNWSNDVPMGADDAALNYGGAQDEGQQARRLQLNASNYRTLRRRSQTRGLLGTRMSQIVDDWLPQPHILHPWPSTRFAVTHPR